MSRPSPERANGWFSQRSIRWMFALVLGIAAFAATWSVIAPDRDVLDVPPATVQGEWATDDARYADRRFLIGPVEFRLQVGPNEVFAYPIREVRQQVGDGGTHYSITYSTLDGLSVHEMTVDSSGGARLRNPADVVWRRR